tara:strand:+ start:5542 stop:6546 length:1005 start_codon:yes stop_codon:yes gene_type:complete
MAIEFITNAITSVFKNKAAKDAIINAAITKVAGGSDKQVLASGLGTFASQEYGIPGIPGTGSVSTINPSVGIIPDPNVATARTSIEKAIEAAKIKGQEGIAMGDIGLYDEMENHIALLQKELEKYPEGGIANTSKSGTPDWIKNIGDYLGFGGKSGLEEKYGKDSIFDKFPGGIGGLAAMGILGKTVYDDYKRREGGIAATPQVMMDSLGRYQLASDMGTGGTRAEFGLAPKPSVLNVAGGGEINRQYFNQGGIAEIDMRDGGESAGSGTGTSDDIPAMLSDGEYVMTAKATRGAGAFDLSKSDSGITLVKTDNPDRERGVANMRELMNIFEEI